MPSIGGEQDTQLYLLKCTGQAKSSYSICESGDHFSHGCSLSALRPTSTQGGVCHNFNRGTKCSQDPCPFNHHCQICDGDHPSYRNYFDKALPFGLRSAPFLFNQLSDALEWLFKNYLNIFPLFISLMTLSSPNKHPAPSVQQLCAGTHLVWGTEHPRLPLKKPFGLPMSWNSLVSPWILLTCRPISLRISLTKHGQCYWGGYPTGFATCGTSSLLLGPFSLPVGSFPWVGPSCNALSTIHKVFPSQSGSFFSMTISVRIFTCSTFFSITGMVSASFFPLRRKRHQTPACVLMPLGWQVMEPFMIIGSLKANGFLPTNSVPSQRLA